MTPVSRLRDTHDVSGGFILIVLETLNQRREVGGISFTPRARLATRFPTHPPIIFKLPPQTNGPGSSPQTDIPRTPPITSRFQPSRPTRISEPRYSARCCCHWTTDRFPNV